MNALKCPYCFCRMHCSSTWCDRCQRHVDPILSQDVRSIKDRLPFDATARIELAKSIVRLRQLVAARTDHDTDGPFYNLKPIP